MDTLTVQQLVEEVLFASIATLVVLFVHGALKRRRVLPLVLAGGVLGILSITPSLLVRLGLAIEVPILLGIGSAGLLLAAGYSYQRNSVRRHLAAAKKAFVRAPGPASPAWHAFQSVQSDEWLRLKGGPDLKVIGYGVHSLAPLLTDRPIGSQVTVFHVVEAKTFVSWVDASYWRYLRRLASLGFSVRLYVDSSSGPAKPHFVKYVRTIAGESVDVDDKSLSRFIAHENGSVYVSAGAFARLAPLIYRCDQALVLTWENYLAEMKTTYDSIGDIIRLAIDKESGREVKLRLDGFTTGFLVAPTSIDLRGEGIDRERTLLLGPTNADTVRAETMNLSDASLEFLVREVVAPICGPWRGPLANFLISLLWMAFPRRTTRLRAAIEPMIIATMLNAAHARLETTNA